MSIKCYLSLNPSGVHPCDAIEEIVYMHSSAFEKMFGKPKCQITDPNILAGYVKISFNGKSVYRKYRSYNMLNGDEAQVDYMTMCQIGFPSLRDEVTIKPTCFWNYQWHTMNKYLRLIFLLTIGSFLLSLMGLIFK